MSEGDDHFDVLIVGAGLSGIDAAYRLQTRCPDKSYAILEARARIGGTWDLFRYPGIRSDSDMYTLGFPFRPWRGDKSIVEGPAIRDYIEDTAREFGIDRRIRFGHRVGGASWSSREARWTVEVLADGTAKRLTCGFLYLCGGYYDYEQGYRPTWPGEEDFAGRIVHPQHWPEDLDHAGKRVAVIGSGATAVTLVPAMAATAAHVTMVQRSPGYVVSRPSLDPLAPRIGPALTRLKNVALASFFFNLARRRPERTREKLLELARDELPEGYEVERHFGPSYNPWEQRLCLVPDGDLFRAIEEGNVSVATGEIERFTAGGLLLASGEKVPADMIVTATGLVVKLMGGVSLDIDGAPADPAGRLVYKGAMLEGVPNLAFAFGYTNASWTLKCDLTARYVCRLLRYMDGRGYRTCMPRPQGEAAERLALIDFSSGYIARASHVLPKQGSKRPWRVPQNYFRDVLTLGLGRVTDDSIEFR
ncbi:flavin-containing monooxygenase [Allosphingosinicella sp.]|jgi:cation diffusion facilitator CzcD-associated flavoprotein CzcO|uniref:flavin-containing monooxygenase n=1 Tax=Allosphingosinicella sp. TaxID=2823234 RepID=UPI002EF0E08F